jgi:hypothetical protein
MTGLITLSPASVPSPALQPERGEGVAVERRRTRDGREAKDLCATKSPVLQRGASLGERIGDDEFPRAPPSCLRMSTMGARAPIAHNQEARWES